MQENYSNYVTAGSWCLNKPENITITRKRTGQPDIVNTTVNNWDASTGNLIYSENEEGYRTTNTYFLGLPTTVTESASDMESRVQTLEYDTKLRFAIKTTNPLGHTTEQLYSSVYGSPVWSKDENGLITTSRYDGFGNPVETFWPNGKKSQTSIFWATPQSPEYCLYYTLTESEGRPWVKTYMDCLGRTLREETPGFNNLVLHTNYQYNEKGQAFKSSFTDPLGEDQWVTRDFDINGRCTSEVSPVNTINYAYTTEADGYKTTATRVLPTSNQKSNQQKLDLTGMLVSSSDAAGKVEYSYNAAGQPVTIDVRTPSTANPVTTSISYDNLGQQLSLNDPDAGPITYTYYKNGALKTQTNANLHTYTMQYDKLGRMISKSNPVDGNYLYFYDTEPNGIGKPSSIQSPGNMSSSFQYDPFGRVIRQSENIAGMQSLQTSFEYDEWGNTTRLIYPGGYAIDYYYDNIGNLAQVKQGSDQTLIWQLNETNAKGQITSCNTGPLTTQYFYTPVNGLLYKIKTGNLFNNSYEFDAQTGNLNWRKNIILNKTENFTYTPSLDQLAAITSTGNPTTSMSYMPNGNILSKSDVGSAEYQYSPLKPHAVETINSANSVISHDYQEITFTPFNKISSISENQKKLQFYYGTDQQRRIMQTRDLSSNALLKEKFYGSQYEKEVDYTTNTTRQWHYISRGDGLSAVYIKTNETGQLYFVAKDHLGSIIGLYNTSGTLVEEYSYDAWGRRRDPLTWAPLTQTPNFLLTRGYTGHEHLDEFGLINMNGRLYDPLLGRMLSPDNSVQSPELSQNFNRYDYCLNNPLKFTDPTGEFFVGTILTGLWDLGTTLFIKGGIDPWNTTSNRNEAWSNFDPTAKWSKTNKAWRIDKGLGVTDHNKTTGSRIWEIVSRFTWQYPQTKIGNLYSHTTNMFTNRVNSVDYFGGATIIDVDNLIWDSDKALGVTLGNYILGEGISSNPFETDIWGDPTYGAMLLRHEYGHYIQSQYNGFLFLPKYGIPSSTDADWTEIDAEYRSDQYFISHYGTDSFIYGPRGSRATIIDPNQYLFITENPNRYQASYKPVNAKWWEYATFIISGPLWGSALVAALNLNNGR